jgi:hypothetical protein
MAIAHVQTGSNGRATGVASRTSVLSSNPAVGNKIICYAAIWVSGVRTISVADNYSNTWTRRAQRDSSGFESCEIWECDVASTGATFTVTVTSSDGSSDLSVLAVEYSGVDTFDKTANAYTIAADAFAAVGPTATLSQADELVCACVSHGSDPTPGAATTGYTNRVLNADGTAIIGLIADDKVVSATTAVSANWTMVVNANGKSSCIVTFRAAAVTFTPRMTLLGVG